MNRKSRLTGSETNGAHTHPKTIEVTFMLEHAQAREVFLSGDFNSWSPRELRMVRQSGGGRWEKRLRLAPGRYEYKFVVDEEWLADPKAEQDVVNKYGSVNSVREVAE